MSKIRISGNVKNGLKWAVKQIPIAFTKNQRYDSQTKKIIQQHCTGDSNCIDVGTHKGEILDLFLKAAPEGIHFGFEPIPYLYKKLEKKYQSKQQVHLFNLALSATEGTASFNLVTTNPAYSGLKKRAYDRVEEDESITVQTRLLDDVVLPFNKKIDLIKIDVEGGEMDVLLGGKQLLQKYAPLIIFEFGIGGSDVYGTTPKQLYAFLSGYGYQVSLLKDFLTKQSSFSLAQFEDQFFQKKNYYFIAHQPHPTS